MTSGILRIYSATTIVNRREKSGQPQNPRFPAGNVCGFEGVFHAHCGATFDENVGAARASADRRWDSGSHFQVPFSRRALWIAEILWRDSLRCRSPGVAPRVSPD